MTHPMNIPGYDAWRLQGPEERPEPEMDTCEACNGTGGIIDDCEECDGTGEVEATLDEPDGDYEYERARDRRMEE
jgi:hypothetical protein